MVKKSLMLLSGLVAANVVPLESAPGSADRPAFSVRAELFEALPGDRVTTESTDRGKGVRWDIRYPTRQNRALVKAVSAGLLQGATAMSFRIRANTRHQLWIQVNDVDGGRYYQIINVEPQWNLVTLPFAELKPNGKVSEDRKLNPDRINKILLLDFSATVKPQRKGRSVWVADWKFASGTVAPAVPTPAGEPVAARPLTSGKVGFTAVPRDFRETEEVWTDFFTKAREAGVQVLSLQAGFWSKIETAPGSYRWRSWEDLFAIMDKLGTRFELSKDFGGPFFHDRYDGPKDISFKSFTDPQLMGRYHQMLRTYLDRFGKRLTYLVIHAEGADSYFGKHPDQLADYCRFLLETRRMIRKHSPHLTVGVNTDPANQDTVLSAMARVTDFMAYDLLNGGIKTPADFDQVVQRLIGLSNGRKIALQNCGWTTSQEDHSNETMQAEFVREFYRVLARHQGRFEYASFGAMYDHDQAITGPAYRAMFPHLPPKYVAKLIDSMSRGGLFRTDGTAKPGWAALKESVAEYYRTTKQPANGRNE